ncbi:MAG: BlaI/MecI/CopY family transcriptional regulator [Acidimicrobiia bacterium]
MWTSRRATVNDVAGDEPFGPLEAELLHLLWSRGGWLSAPDAHEALAAHRPLAYTTVSTVLIRLWQKGHLERVRDGRAFAYRAVHTKEQHTAARMAGLLAELDDRPRALSWFLEFLDADERAQLRRLLKRPPTEP